MSFTDGLNEIKIQNIVSIQLTSQVTIEVNGDNVLDGLTINESRNTTITNAGGIDIVTSEKVIVDFTLVEGTESSINYLMAMKNTRTTLLFKLSEDDDLYIQVTGIIQVHRTVVTNNNIGYKISMEVNASDIDTIVTRKPIIQYNIMYVGWITTEAKIPNNNLMYSADI